MPHSSRSCVEGFVATRCPYLDTPLTALGSVRGWSGDTSLGSEVKAGATLSRSRTYLGGGPAPVEWTGHEVHQPRPTSQLSHVQETGGLSDAGSRCASSPGSSSCR